MRPAVFTAQPSAMGLTACNRGNEERPLKRLFRTNPKGISDGRKTRVIPLRSTRRTMRPRYRFLKAKAQILLNGSRIISTGNLLKLSPDFPPIHTAHERFRSHGVPSSLFTAVNQVRISCFAPKDIKPDFCPFQHFHVSFHCFSLLTPVVRRSFRLFLNGKAMSANGFAARVPML